MTPPLPPKRPGSRPDLNVLDQKPESLGENQGRLDTPAAKRSPTLTNPGGRASGEFAQTMPVPAEYKVTPAAGTVAVRQKPIEVEVDWPPISAAPETPSSLPPASADPKEAQIAALRRRAEAAEKEAAIWRWLKRFVGKKAGMLVASVLGVGGGGLALQQATKEPEPPPVVYVTKGEIAALKEAHDKERVSAAKAYNQLVRAYRCSRRQQIETSEQLLPSKDHMGSARKPQPFGDECSDVADLVKLLDVTATP